MTSDGARILPFLGASVAVHAIAIGVLGTDPLAVSLSERGTGHEVSIRLEAAAPATPSAESARQRLGPEPDPTAVARPPQPTTSPTKRASTDPVETASRDASSIPDERSPAEPKAKNPNETADDKPTRATPDPQERAHMTNARARRAERVGRVPDPGTGASSTTARATTNEAREALVAELAKHFHYPRIARRRGWQGTVVLSVRILPNGRLANIRVVRSSGRAVLDRSALGSLGDVRRLPQFADRVGSTGLALEIPVTYRLESA